MERDQSMSSKTLKSCKFVLSSRMVPTTIMILALVIFTLLTTSMGYGASEKTIEAPQGRIMAAYLIKFLPFVSGLKKGRDDTPQAETVTIGIVGKDPFGDNFKSVEGKTIRSIEDRLEIKRFGPFSNKNDLKQCHLLFISSSEKDNIKKILYKIEERAILTVAEYDGFLESGGMIKLVKRKNRILWEINMGAVKDSGLTLNYQFIRAAVRVVNKDKQKK